MDYWHSQVAHTHTHTQLASEWKIRVKFIYLFVCFVRVVARVECVFDLQALNVPLGAQTNHTQAEAAAAAAKWARWLSERQQRATSAPAAECANINCAAASACNARHMLSVKCLSASLFSCSLSFSLSLSVSGSFLNLCTRFTTIWLIFQERERENHCKCWQNDDRKTDAYLAKASTKLDWRQQTLSFLLYKHTQIESVN